MKVIVFVLLKLYTFIISGYCLVPFVYLSFGRWWAIYRKLYFIGLIAILPMPFLWSPVVRNLMKIYFPYEKKSETIDESAVKLENHIKNHQN